MKLLANLDHLYAECKGNQWLRYFAIFCRVASALGFIPSGIVKVMGGRFTALPSNHPLGHYFDAARRPVSVTPHLELIQPRCPGPVDRWVE
jgi:hypothetical protein